MSKRKNFSTDLPCTICGCTTENGNTFHHVKSRGAGGLEVPWNEMPLCQTHHNEAHNSKGLPNFARNNPTVKSWLIENDWEILELNGKWFHEE